MSTLCAMYIHHDDLGAVSAALRTAMLRSRPTAQIDVVATGELSGVYGRGFRLSTAKPTRLAASAAPAGWCTVHYNSFARLDGEASAISSSLSTRVVVVMAQTVSEAYHIAVYDHGRQRRLLEYADPEWRLDEGSPLPFEAEVLARRAPVDRTTAGNQDATDADVDDCLSQERVTRFCRWLGVDIEADAAATWQQWTIREPSWWRRVLCLRRR